MTAVRTQVSGLLWEFKSCKMPWPAERCRSKRAGWSGICFALPVVCCAYRGERLLWCLQAFMSVLADYVFIGRSSVVHGLDRVLASLMLVRLIYECTLKVHSLFALWALPPLAFFALAAHAKSTRDAVLWKYAHCLWHVAGGLLAAFSTCRLHEDTCLLQNNPALACLLGST